MVRLVQHERLNLVEVQKAPVEQVENSSGATHHDLRPAPQRVHLTLDRNPTVDRHRLQTRELRERANLGRDLRSEFAGGSDHQGAGALAMRLEQPVKKGQRKGRRLAGSGLRQAEHISTGETSRNRLELNLPRAFEAGMADSTHEGFVEPEPVESGRTPGY